MNTKIQKITPNFWFNQNAEEAVNYYITIFKDAKIERMTYYTSAGKEEHGMEEGQVMTIDFQLEGQQFIALNGGPQFSFSEAISFIINCESQEEIDYYWDRLSAGGDEKSQICGWLKDKFGLSWQVVPVELDDMLARGNEEQVKRVMNELLKMKKLDLSVFRKVFAEAASNS